MKRFLYVIAALAVIAVVAAVALPFVLSPAFIGGKLSEAVEQATGRRLVIGGAPRLALWPELAVEIDDVVLANPQGMYEGRFVSMDRLRLRIGLEPLVQRRLEVREAILVRPRIGLVVDSDGRANWSFATPGSAARSDEGGGAVEVAGIALAPIVIEDGEIRYLDQRSATAMAIEHVDLTITAPDPQGPVNLEGHVTWKGQRFKLAFFAKSPQRLSGEGSPIDLAVNGALIDFTFNGLARLDGGVSLAGTMEMKSSSLRDLAEWTGKPLAPGGGLQAFAVKGAFDLAGSSISLKEATIVLDGMNGQGSLGIDTGGTRPSVTASLGLDRLDVNAYLGLPAPQSPATAEGIEAWSAAPIDLAGLAAVDARLALAASAISLRGIKTGKTRIDATLKDGRLDARLSEMAFYDGKAAGRIVLSSAGGDAVVQGTLNADNLDGYRLLKDFAQFERLAGKTSLTLALAARGKSQRELVSTLRGAAGLRFTSGAVRGINIASMIRNVQTGILTGWDKAESKDTDFAALEANYTIEDGVATGNDLKLLGPLIRMSATGSVDLLRRRLDYKVEPRLVATLEGQGGAETTTGLPVPIVVEGPWGNPRIYPDIKGMLKDPQAAYDALRNMTGIGKDLDLKAQATKIEDKAKVKVEKAIGDKAGKALGDEGKSLLKGLFGKKKPATDTSQ